MTDFKNKSLNLIRTFFTDRNFKCFAFSNEEREELDVYNIDFIPRFVCTFTAIDETSDINACIENIVPNVPKEKYVAAITACGYINANLRFWKFFLNEDASVYMSYDFLCTTPDKGNAIAFMAFELLKRAEQCLDYAYPLLIRNLFDDHEKRLAYFYETRGRNCESKYKA